MHQPHQPVIDSDKGTLRSLDLQHYSNSVAPFDLSGGPVCDTVLGAEFARLYTLGKAVVRLPHPDSTVPGRGTRDCVSRWWEPT